MGGGVRFVSGREENIADLANGLVIAVDIGYSNPQRTTGVAWRTPGERVRSKSQKFGAALTRVTRLFERHGSGTLILEAPLWGMFSGEGEDDGNPMMRFFEVETTVEDGAEKERYRGWDYDSGAATCLAALMFLRELERRLEASQEELEIVVYEGFLTFKAESTRHEDDATLLCQAFLGERSRAPIDKTPSSTDETIVILDFLSGGVGHAPPAIIKPFV